MTEAEREKRLQDLGEMYQEALERGEAMECGPGSRVLHFFAAGIPAPKGSTRSFLHKGHVVTKHANERSKPWQGVVAWAASQASDVPLAGPVELRLVFYMPRPKGHLKKCGTPRDSAPRTPTGKPDLDKLERCVLDALTGVAYLDDSQVDTLESMKRWASSDQPPGASVTVTWRQAP